MTAEVFSAADHPRWRATLAKMVQSFNETEPCRETSVMCWTFSHADQEQVFLAGAAAHGMRFSLVPGNTGGKRYYALQRLAVPA